MNKKKQGVDKYEVVVEIENAGVLDNNSDIEEELSEILKTLGVSIKGRIFVSNSVAEVVCYRGFDAPFLRRFAITDSRDIVVFSIAMMLIGMPGIWRKRGMENARKMVAGEVKSVCFWHRDENPVGTYEPFVDLFETELKLDSPLDGARDGEVGS